MTATSRLRVAVVGTGRLVGARARPCPRRRTPTSICVRSSGVEREDGAQADEFATTPYVDLDQMLDDETPDLVSLCLPNEAPLRNHLDGDPGRISAPGRKAASSSTSAKPTGLLARSRRRETCSSRSISTIATPVPCSWHTRPSPRVRSATSRSPPGGSAARSGPARTRTRTSSRRNATASTCSSTCAARSHRSVPT